ncbi:hypothetical protein [Neobacillus terrae]|uniref:hypothetical protein n=1 Tax=Neobacillus terrae TaxID=3034837 RepID=UPI001FB133F6|nr:hypothetical protein [Neobacillus terrae]
MLKSLGFALGFLVAPLLLKKLPLPEMVASMHGLLITTVIAMLVIANSFRIKANNTAIGNKSQI